MNSRNPKPERFLGAVTGLMGGRRARAACKKGGCGELIPLGHLGKIEEHILAHFAGDVFVCNACGAKLPSLLNLPKHACSEKIFTDL